MKKIIEINEEILNIYNILENNLSNEDKEILLSKLKDLINKENELYDMLDITIDNYDDYLIELIDCKDMLIKTRINHYLDYLYSKFKVFFPGLIYFEDADKDLRYYKYFELEMETTKIMLKNNPGDIYKALFIDKLLEKEYIENNYKLENKNIENNLSEEEIKLFKISKKKYIIDQIVITINIDVIDNNLNMLNSFIEFSSDDYEEIYNEIVNKIDEKDKLDEFNKIFGNRNKFK